MESWRYFGGKPDAHLLAFVLCSLISLLWCYLLAGTARNLVFSATNRFYATLKTGILTLLVFIILVSTIAINRLPINELLDISVFLSVTSGELLKLCWYSLLSPVVFGVFVFFANHLVLNAFDIERAITWGWGGHVLQVDCRRGWRDWQRIKKSLQLNIKLDE